MSKTYGFIITRHVNSEKTNQYWNLCIKRIRQFYDPVNYKIIVIDDNSELAFLKPFEEYENVEIVQSEFPGRGELLPYYYFYKNHYFDSAIIIHDSVFFQTKINFDKLSDLKVVPFWHFQQNRSEKKLYSITLIEDMKNAGKIKQLLLNSDQYSSLKLGEINWKGCFGVQAYIQYDFLTSIQEKYNIFSLLSVVKTRKDRCCLERIMATIFYLEFKELIKINSILGDIYQYFRWNYSFDDYMKDINSGRRPNIPLVKVWSGR